MLPILGAIKKVLARCCIKQPTIDILGVPGRKEQKLNRVFRSATDIKADLYDILTSVSVFMAATIAAAQRTSLAAK